MPPLGWVEGLGLRLRHAQCCGGKAGLWWMCGKKFSQEKFYHPHPKLKKKKNSENLSPPGALETPMALSLL